jgi:uncharacterized RDD family membrane protein YckC
MTATQQPDPFGVEPTPAKGPSGPRAGFWLRFAAAFVDGIVLSLVTLPFRLSLAAGAYLFISTLIGIAYYTLLEGGPKGQTVGKMACGIRVYDLANGGPIGYGRGFIRYIGRIVSAIPLLLGYFWMIWDKEKQTFHDKFAGSVVVPTSSYPVG